MDYRFLLGCTGFSREDEHCTSTNKTKNTIPVILEESIDTVSGLLLEAAPHRKLAVRINASAGSVVSFTSA